MKTNQHIVHLGKKKKEKKKKERMQNKEPKPTDIPPPISRRQS